MSLTTGTKLGPYEIVGQIGAGGMGEVYKAKDTRLDRTVAIKVLPSHLADNPDLKLRFEREARTVSSLNHPHICTLYDVGEQDGTDFLVMEYIEGESLADRLKKGALPLDQALRYAIEVADALDKAHRQGVVHRDLKPGNIMLTKSGAKLLDFGLAKLKGVESGQEASVLSALPTEEKPLTEKGSILGTFQYMAPEQLEAKDTDARTDIFAFGAVVYEMVTGKRTFEGKSQASLITAIMGSEPPPISKVQPMSPPMLDHVVQRCLAKDPDGRWQSASDLMLELEWIAEAGSGAGVPSVALAGRGISRRLSAGIGLGTMIVALLAGIIAGWILKPPPPRPVGRFSISLPPTGRLNFQGRPAVALSPDSEHLVYVANEQLYLRAMDELEATSMRGTEGGSNPFFSPDGQWVGFWAGGELKKVPLSGGPPQKMCNARNPYGVTWGPDDTIFFADLENILKVPATGGEPEIVISPDREAGETQIALPEILPDGDTLLFNVMTGGGFDNTHIVAQSLETNERSLVLDGGSQPRYVATGHLVYLRAYTLMAVPFDPGRLEVKGSSVPLVEDVRRLGDRSAHFSVSRSGGLAYISGASTSLARVLVWVDREGREEALTAEPRAYRYPRISSDGTRVALDIRDQERDIWIWDFARETLTRLTFDPGSDETSPWTPNGRRVAFASDREDQWNLFWRAADGTGTVERLTESENIQFPYAFTPDGKRLVFGEIHPERGRDLRVHALEGDGPSEPLLATEFDERNAELSPDGRWLAYDSDASGQFEIYVRPFPNVDEGMWMVSNGGGRQPLWGPAGRELFYRGADERLMVVPYQTDPTFSAGNAEVLFEESYYSGGTQSPGRTYDISRDGERFLMIKESEEVATAPTSITVVLNWLEELKRLVPTDK